MSPAPTLDVVYLAWNRVEFTQLSFDLLLRNTDWDRVRRLAVYDDGSTDGTREYLDDAISACPVPAGLTHLGFGSPVATMNHYLGAEDPPDLFAKIDNDIAVPPGWLDAMLGVLERNPELELLGMEAGQTELVGRTGEPPWEGEYGYRPCRHIGGVGVMRTSAFLSRDSPTPKGRFGFTKWQYDHDPVRGWIEPDLRVPQLDRVPAEPWRSFSHYYVAQGWQRPWPPMDERWSRDYYAWMLQPPPVERPKT